MRDREHDAVQTYRPQITLFGTSGRYARAPGSRVMRTHRKAGIAAMVALVAAQLAWAGNPGSQEVAVNIEAQRMDQALNALAQQTGMQVLFRAEKAVEGVRAPRVVGKFTAQQALE